jgi:lipopolysaccharide export system protein LptC
MRLFLYTKTSFITVGSVFAGMFFLLGIVNETLPKHQNISWNTDNPLITNASLVEYSSYDEDGIILSYLKAGTLKQYYNQKVELTDVLEKRYTKNGDQSSEVTSKNAASDNLNKEDKPLRLWDDVQIIIFNKEGDKKSEISKKVYINSDELFYNTYSNDFYSDKYIKISDPYTGNTTTGIGVKGNMSTVDINIHKDVRSYYASR